LQRIRNVEVSPEKNVITESTLTTFTWKNHFDTYGFLWKILLFWLHSFEILPTREVQHRLHILYVDDKVNDFHVISEVPMILFRLFLWKPILHYNLRGKKTLKIFGTTWIGEKFKSTHSQVCKLLKYFVLSSREISKLLRKIIFICGYISYKCV